MNGTSAEQLVSAGMKLCDEIEGAAITDDASLAVQATVWLAKLVGKLTEDDPRSREAYTVPLKSLAVTLVNDDGRRIDVERVKPALMILQTLMAEQILESRDKPVRATILRLLANRN